MQDRIPPKVELDTVRALHELQFAIEDLRHALLHRDSLLEGEALTRMDAAWADARKSKVWRTV